MELYLNLSSVKKLWEANFRAYIFFLCNNYVFFQIARVRSTIPTICDCFKPCAPFHLSCDVCGIVWCETQLQKSSQKMRFSVYSYSLFYIWPVRSNPPVCLNYSFVTIFRNALSSPKNCGSSLIFKAVSSAQFLLSFCRYLSRSFNLS